MMHGVLKGGMEERKRNGAPKLGPADGRRAIGEPTIEKFG